MINLLSHTRFRVFIVLIYSESLIWLHYVYVHKGLPNRLGGTCISMIAWLAHSQIALSVFAENDRNAVSLFLLRVSTHAALIGFACLVSRITSPFDIIWMLDIFN